MLLKVSRTDSFEIVCRKEFFQLDKRRDILVLISCECHDFTSFILPLHTFSEVNLLWPTCLIRAHFREGRKPTDNFVYVYARKFSLSLSLCMQASYAPYIEFSPLLLPFCFIGSPFPHFFRGAGATYQMVAQWYLLPIGSRCGWRADCLHARACDLKGYHLFAWVCSSLRGLYSWTIYPSDTFGWGFHGQEQGHFWTPWTGEVLC